MNKKKKIIIAVCAVILIALLATAAYFYFSKEKKEPPTMEETVNSRISAYETDLTDSIPSMTSQEAVRKYLVNWAENKGIDVKTDSAGNVIYSLKATEGFENQSPSVILCGYDYASMGSYVNSIACALTVAKNDNPHGEYKVIFVSEEIGNKKGAEALSEKYFTDDTKVFCLGDTHSSRLSLSTGGFSKYALSKNLNYTDTSYDTAYRVSISGLPAHRFSSMNSNVPNPIKTLGNLLANFKSTSILFELSSFSGGGDSDVIPQDASVVIVVNEDSAEKLEKNLNSAIEKFYDKYGDDYPDAEYAFEVVETPSQVISTEDTESIISLLYTAINGEHYKDDNGEIASIANIGRISTENRTLNIEVAASSYSDELTAEMAEAYETISALTDVKYTLSESSAPFHANESGEELADEFHSAYTEYQNINLDKVDMAEWTPALTVSSKNQSMAVIAFGVTQRTKDNFAGGLITYLQTPEAEEEQ